MFSPKELLFLVLLFVVADFKLVVRKLTTTTPTRSTVPTKPNPTTTKEDPGCPASDLKPFRRKNGWWCMLATIYDQGIGGAPMGKTYAANNCRLNKMVLSSLETDEEWTYWRNYLVNDIGYISGVFMAMTKNETNGNYYWNDGQAVPTLKYPQPVVAVSGGEAAWIVDKKSTTVPYGYLAVVPATGNRTSTTPNISMGVCGIPGRQFT